MTRSLLVLVGHSLKRIRGMLFALGFILTAFQFLLIQVAGYLVRQSAFSQLSALIPDFVRSAAGGSALAFMSFRGIVGLGYFHPVVLAALVGLTITVATEPTAEVESRFVDLTLARPLARFQLMMRSLIVFMVAGGLVLAFMIVGSWAALACCAPIGADRPPLPVVLLLAVELAAIMTCWAGVGLAVASVSRRRAVAGGLTGALALAAYLLDYLGRAWEPAATVSTVSPFHYFEPMTTIMTGAISGGDIAVLLGVGTIATVFGFVAFARRDL